MNCDTPGLWIVGRDRRIPPPSQRGSLILLVMCLLAVLGIALASYLAVANNSMKLSNRAYAASLGRHLAEAGLTEGLRAFNYNNFATWTANGTTATWSDNGTNGKKCTLSFPSTKFGTSGITGTVKIRVDNYNTNILNATWNSSTTYRIGDLVGYNGIWYRSVRNNNLNQTPSSTSLTWWVPNPMPWTWSSNTTYAQYEMVNYKGVWYRCIATPPVSAGTTTYAPQVPLPATTYWTPIPTMRAWASGTAYSVYDVVAYTDVTTGDVSLYRCTTAHTSSASISTDISNWSSNVQTVSLAWSSGTVYTRGAMVYYVGSGVTSYRWYYCIQSGTSNTAPSADTTMWAPVWYDNAGNVGAGNGPFAVNPGSDTLVNPTYYVLGDYVYRSSVWYRCTTPHTYSGTWIAGNWTSTNALPYLQLFYFGPGSLSTNSNSIFYYAGSYWYRYMGGYVLALTGTMHAWVSGYKYSIGDAVYYSSTARWYRCIQAHTASGTITPSNTTYWATGPAHSNSWSSTRQYGQYDTVFYNGVWYLSLQGSNYGQNPASAASYWVGANTSTTSYQWNSTTAYSAGDYKCYGRVWYKCTNGNTGQSPNNSNYWTASWANAWGVTTGAPVIYAESTVTLPDGTASIKTQIRAALSPAPLFPNAVAANSSAINASSGGTVDSYDSTSGTVATQGGGTTVAGYTNSGTYAYHQGAATNFAAVVASNYSAGTAITLSSTDVKGYLAAPPNTSTGAPLYSTGGTVKGYNTSPSTSIDLNQISRSPSIPVFDTIPGGSGGLSTNWATTPKGTALSLTSTTNVGTPGDTVPSRYYYGDDLTIGGAGIQYLNINGPIILYVNGDLSITNSSSTGRINLGSAGSAEIHVAGVFKADVGGEGILSYTSDPKSLVIISDSTSSNSSFYSEGVNDLYGVIYVPYSTSTTGYYNDNNNTEIFGAVSANKVTYSGANMNIHYDTSLRYRTTPGVDQPYFTSEWRELTDPTEQANMP